MPQVFSQLASFLVHSLYTRQRHYKKRYIQGNETKTRQRHKVRSKTFKRLSCAITSIVSSYTFLRSNLFLLCHRLFLNGSLFWFRHFTKKKKIQFQIQQSKMVCKRKEIKTLQTYNTGNMEHRNRSSQDQTLLHVPF